MAKKETKSKPSDPEAAERQRLKRLAISNGMISEAPPKPSSASLNPSKTVIKHHGKDIIKKSNRKNRYLFSFPGLLAPVASGGKIGDLKDLGTKNPILYLIFPQGRVKLFGTIMYPKNKYLTLQFSRGGKNVMCEDSFDAMIVFSEAWWIGSKEKNPEEARLEFPKELTGEHPDECDFKGGAGSTTENKPGVNKPIKFVEEKTPETDLEDDSSKSENNATELLKQTPTRHSARTSGKSYKFADAFSTDDESNADILTISKKKSEKEESNVIEDSNAKIKPVEDPKVSKSSSEVAASISRVTRGSLVQPTITNLFKKAEKKKEPTKSTNITPLTVVVPKLQNTKATRRIDLDEVSEPRKKRKLVKGSDSSTTKTQAVGSGMKQPITSQRNKPTSDVISDPVTLDEGAKDEDDGIEEFTSSSQEIFESDEDWAGDL